MAENCPEVVVHGGVHKTATSHIQSILQRNAGRLRKHGIYYLNHRETRKKFTYPCQLHGYEKLGLKFKRTFSKTELRRETGTFFESVGARNGDRIILSDENMPGHCGQCVGNGSLYNRRDTFLPIFAQEIPFTVTEVHIAVRNYADFFASAYVEYLRSATGQGVLCTEAQMRRALLSKMPSWVDYVSELRSTFSEARLIIWRHEDFQVLQSRIMQNLIGSAVSVQSLEQPKRSRGRPSASQTAMRELQLTIHREGVEVGLSRRAEIQEAYPRGPAHPRYDPWTKTQRAHLTQVYERDVEDIMALGGVSFLLPD